MRDAFVRALTELAAEDSSVLLVNGDLGFGVLTDFIERFPANYVNAGVAEQNMTAVACGAALTGARSYTYSIGNFPTLRCLEQLRNDVCYHAADVTAVAVGGGFSYGQLGMSHFATEDLAILRALPGMTVVAPSDPWQAYALTRQLHARGGPAYLRLDKSGAGLPEGEVELGKVRQVRDGHDAVIFATGGILREAIAAADLLSKSGRQVRVIDVHTIKPLDTIAICHAAGECRHVVTLEEHNVIGGLGGAVAEVCLENGVALGHFRRIGLHDCYPDVVGDQDYLRARYGMDRHAVVAVLVEMLAS
ncbi:transketolase family protein [Sphingomonas sp.]|jgi:transketolase|uniref:transketolase family protein n=1 Tax=Sphingomonas sp. TaxID=28214 RepID=UPI002E31CC2C|nr:transketolase C-terminal domain-containing protein [Sphingomonas sp.]HEX4695441.1 transketolase C-terminal domain-containing protein [Sphingomonas sp.]